MPHLTDPALWNTKIFLNLQEGTVGWAQMKCGVGISPQVHTQILFPPKEKNLTAIP